MDAELLRRIDGLYIRIQPAGLPVESHRSESSDGEAEDGVYAWDMADLTWAFSHPEGVNYGDEILVLVAEETYEPGDVEGVVAIDPQILRRFSWAEMANILGDCVHEWRGGENGRIEIAHEANSGGEHIRRLLEAIGREESR